MKPPARLVFCLQVDWQEVGVGPPASPRSPILLAEPGVLTTSLPTRAPGGGLSRESPWWEWRGEDKGEKLYIPDPQMQQSWSGTPALGHLPAPHPSLAPLLELQRPLSEALTQMCTMYPERLVKPALGHRAVQRATCPANVPRHFCSGPAAQTPPSPRGPLHSSLPRCTPHPQSSRAQGSQPVSPLDTFNPAGPGEA